MINILLVDDMEGNLTILQYLIEEYMGKKGINDYKILSYTDPHKAIQVVQNKKIHIIFLDIMMPYMNGFEFLQIVRNNSSLDQPIVVMVTALLGKKSKEKNQAFGANAYIIKPIKGEIINMMLDRYMEVLKHDRFDITDTFDFHQDIQELEGIQSDSQSFYEKYSPEDIEDTLEDINHAVFKIFDCVDSSLMQIPIDLESQIKNIELVFKEFQNLFVNFEELEELRFLIGNFNLLFETYNMECVDKQSQEEISNILKSMILELLDYKEKVFIECSVTDLNYIKPELENKHKQIDQILKA